VNFQPKVASIVERRYTFSKSAEDCDTIKNQCSSINVTRRESQMPEQHEDDGPGMYWTRLGQHVVWGKTSELCQFWVPKLECPAWMCEL